ncbi:MAG: hypothetical protein WCF04_07015 [Candidatus Nanopelagicales bacterium]
MIPDTELAGAVAARVGGLNTDEQTRLYGAAQAVASADPYAPVLLPPTRIDEVAAAILAGRTGPCGFCHVPFSDHTLTVSPDRTDIWCPDSTSGRRVAEWLRGPFHPSPLHVLAGIVIWVGIPAVSLGLLSWLTPAVAGARRRRRAWLVAAAVLGTLTVAELILAGMSGAAPAFADAVGPWLVFGSWIGSMVYGALQVKPWLATLGQLKRTEGTQFGTPAGSPLHGAPVGEPTDPRAPKPTRTSGLVAWLHRQQARMEADRAQRLHARKLAAWQSEDDQRRYALWCADALLAGGRAGFDGAPIILRRGESLLWAGAGQLIEPRRAPGQYRGGSAGVSVPIGLGMRANFGSHRGTYQPGPELQTPVDTGAVAVTSARVVFTGDKKTREWALAKLLTVQQSGDGRVTLLPVSNRQAVSGVHVRTDSARFGTALEITAAAQAGDLPTLRSELAAHLAQHQLSRPEDL